MIKVRYDQSSLHSVISQRLRVPNQLAFAALKIVSKFHGLKQCCFFSLFLLIHIFGWEMLLYVWSGLSQVAFRGLGSARTARSPQHSLSQSHPPGETAWEAVPRVTLQVLAAQRASLTHRPLSTSAHIC